MDIKNRNRLTAALAVLFGLGALFNVAKHDWFDAGLAGAASVLALIALFFRRSRTNA